MRAKFLVLVMFAVTMLMAGAWAQTDDYPQQPPGQPGDQGQGPGAQAPGDQGQGPGAQGQGDQSAQQSEGPAPDVARISLIKGDVTSQRADTGDWSATTVNAPLMRGDQVATGDNSRTEIQLDPTNLVRLAGHSQVKIADLSRSRIQIQVAQGYANYSVFKGSEADVEIDTPNVAVHPLQPGRYRVQVVSDGETDVIVREGEAEVTTQQGSTRVKEGDLITIRGTDNPEYRVDAAPARDDWDQWNRDRDNVINSSQSVSHTNRNYTGVNDLDNNGRWIYVPGYGNVWQPYQQASWAPYQAGRWVWEPYYGWTWVSYESWGWAPYHYGRWFLNSGSWCWWPGPVYVGYRPVWSPAFVFFVGFGHHSAFGFGSIGWFPVGPHDYFYPWYGRGFNRVNVVSVTNINVINRGGFVAPLAVRGRQPFFSNASLVGTNARVRGSITTVSSTDFGRGDFSHRQFGVDERQWRDGRVMTANLPVVPSRENLRVSAQGRAGMPASVQPRNGGHFYTQHQPPAGPESFHTQVDRVQRVVGSQGMNARTGIAEVPRNDRQAGGSVGNEQPRGEINSRSGRPEGANNVGAGDNRDRSGWNRFGSPSGRPGSDSGNNGPRSEPSSPVVRSNDQGRVSRTGNSTPAPQEERGGWQRFPSNSNNNDRGARSNDSPVNRNERGEAGGYSKPPLDLHRPIVTPRQDSRPDTRNDQGYRPSPSRTPDTRNDRYSPPPRSDSGRYNPPPRSDSGRYNPPSHSQSPRYSPPSRSGNSSSSHGGSSERGGHSDSKSSSSHKQR
jgi:hypothetical protein